MKRIGRLATDSRGAVAPTVALSLFALIAAGGIAFDYARLAAMHSELQNAADQAALAAATQLDGRSGACARAVAAARDLLRNETLLANDRHENKKRKGAAVTITAEEPADCDDEGLVRFYKSYDQETDKPGEAATDGADAKVVIVKVDSRKAFYALTPIVAVFSSGEISAEAVAGLEAGVCNIPPLMVCSDPDTPFPTSADVGKGVLLQPGPNAGSWAAGNYGYLDFGNGASGLKTNLASNSYLGCHDSTEGLETEPGNKASVTDGLNTRFDLYAPGQASCQANGDGCPAQNTRKDLVKTEQAEVTVNATDPVPDNPGCGAPGAKIVDQSNSTDTNGFAQEAATTSFPRDNCHASGGCATGNFGNGSWSRDAYFAALHPTTSAAAVAASLGKSVDNLSRFDVYKWELVDPARRLAVRQTNVTPKPVPYKDNGGGTANDNSDDKGKGKDKDKDNSSGKSSGGTRTYTFTNQCAYPQAVNGTPVAPSKEQKDRRLVTVAVANCTGLNGKGKVDVLNLMDVFLVEPSLDRSAPYATGKSQIYGEIAGIAKKPDGTSAFQFYHRQRPRLLK